MTLSGVHLGVSLACLVRRIENREAIAVSCLLHIDLGDDGHYLGDAVPLGCQGYVLSYALIVLHTCESLTSQLVTLSLCQSLHLGVQGLDLNLLEPRATGGFVA